LRWLQTILADHSRLLIYKFIIFTKEIKCYSIINVLKGRQHLESKWLKDLLAKRIKDGERRFPALASSREPHWCLDKQGKALYTDLDISPVKSYLQ